MMQPREDVMQKRERESLSLCLKSSFCAVTFWEGRDSAKQKCQSKKKRVGGSGKHLDPAGPHAAHVVIKSLPFLIHIN